MNSKLVSKSLFAAFALALSLLVSLPEPAQACLFWQCYGWCGQSFSDCTQFGLGDICAEEWASCVALCEAYYPMC